MDSTPGSLTESLEGLNQNTNAIQSTAALFFDKSTSIDEFRSALRLWRLELSASLRNAAATPTEDSNNAESHQMQHLIALMYVLHDLLHKVTARQLSEAANLVLSNLAVGFLMLKSSKLLNFPLMKNKVLRIVGVWKERQLFGLTKTEEIHAFFVKLMHGGECPAVANVQAAEWKKHAATQVSMLPRIAKGDLQPAITKALNDGYFHIDGFSLLFIPRCDNGDGDSPPIWWSSDLSYVQFLKELGLMVRNAIQLQRDLVRKIEVKSLIEKRLEEEKLRFKEEEESEKLQQLFDVYKQRQNGQNTANGRSAAQGSIGGKPSSALHNQISKYTHLANKEHSQRVALQETYVTVAHGLRKRLLQLGGHYEMLKTQREEVALRMKQ